MRISKQEGIVLLDQIKNAETENIESLKHIAFTGPSGSGKSTLIQKHEQSLIRKKPDKYGFSISGATRLPRNNEVHGRDYFFMDVETFLKTPCIEDNVYGGNKKYYGTLYSEVYRICVTEQKRAAFDVDINGGKALKDFFGTALYWVFLRVPITTLERRLYGRQAETGESDDTIKSRIITAENEQYLVKTKQFIPNLILDYGDDVFPGDAVREVLFKSMMEV